MNKTKVIATVGPATSDREMIKSLIMNGVDVIRINMSHADMAFCRDIVEKVNSLNDELRTFTATMIDLKGPIVQIGKISYGQAWLKKDDKIRVMMDETLGDNTKFSVTYKGLINDVSVGMSLNIADGEVVLKVLEKGVDYLLCQVIKEGYIYDNKCVSVPEAKLRLPFIDEKDYNAVKLAHDINADFLCVSYAKSSEDVLEINDLLINLGNDHLQIITKIENQSAIDDIDNIIKISDGIMVARGDLGAEINLEQIPGIQKKIINKCHTAGVISIVATDLLASMEISMSPTRAEVSDIANAVLDGIDAVMLSGETTTGKYPIETIKTMEKIIRAAENDVNYSYLMDLAIKSEKKDMTGVLAYNVAGCANLLNCKAIFAPTMSGYTAKKMSRFRPSCPIVAVSPDMNTVKSLSLNFGVFPVLIDDLKSLDTIINKSKKIAKEWIGLKEKDLIVITGGYPFKSVKHTNFMKIEEI